MVQNLSTYTRVYTVFHHKRNPIFGFADKFSVCLSYKRVTWRQNFELNVAANAEGADWTLDPQRDIAISVLDGKLRGAKRPEKGSH